MENLVKLLPVIAVVALVVIIFLLGYVKLRPMWPTSFPVYEKGPGSDWASGYPNSVSGACR